MDRLAVLMARFPVTAQVFHAGALCGLHTLECTQGLGQLHLVRRGPLEVQHGRSTLHIPEPSLLLYPRPLTHRFVADGERGADLVCAHLRFEGAEANPVCAALPEVVLLPLAQIVDAGPVLELLFAEAFAERCGRTAVLNRLFEVVVIQILRVLMEQHTVQGGLLAGMADPRLRHTLVAMHEAPAQDWTLDTLAATAGLSRSVFAARFRTVLGLTPGHYLQGWRVQLAQQALRQGRPLKVVADQVGYGSEAALSRAFKAHCGSAPRAWLRANGAASAQTAPAA